MPRGFKVDIAATLARFGYERWKPGLSFVSQPKIIKGECPIQQDYLGRTYELRPHLVLYGDDKGPIRAEIFRRNREANDGLLLCWKCRNPVVEYPEDDWRDQDIKRIASMMGEWHHVRNKPGERCDCPENGIVSCSACHKPEHPQTQFGR